MIHTVLADDEVLARQKLRQLLRNEPEIEVVGEGDDGARDDRTGACHQTAAALSRHPDARHGWLRYCLRASFLQSHVPMPHIIFTTAHDQYALRAFEIHAMDYLLKPFTQERLSAAVERARKEILHRQSAACMSGAASQNGSRYTTRIVFKSRGRIIFLPVSDIRWISAEENYVRISTQTETHLLRETMAHLEEKLDPEMFLRVHRSSIVNLATCQGSAH